MDYSSLIVLLVVSSSPALGNKLYDPTQQTARSNLVELLSDIKDGVSSFANLVLSFDSILNGHPPKDDTPQDAFLSISQLATKYGYNIEEHRVVTEDGYILTVHRLKGRQTTSNGKVVFLMHGIIESSDCWVLQGPDKALGYILADNGFDVWMGNGRGNKHSMAHTALRPDDTDFWQFTWEEIGLYDLPAMIDHVLNATNNKSLYYVGHSQGTTSFLVMNSMKPQYNEKINLMFALSPVAWMGNVRSPLIRRISSSLGFLGYFMSNLKSTWPSMELLNKITAASCGHVAQGCETLLYLLEGNEHENINATLMPVILGHMPTGASAAQFVHYAQLVNSGRFSRFDFGEELNYLEYGARSAPDYPVWQVSAAVHLFGSDGDQLSAAADARMLRDRLPNVVGYDLLEGFTHLDYLYATNAKEEIYDKIVREISEN